MSNKGFGGLPPHEQRFWKLVNAMLAGYFDGRLIEELAEDIHIKHQVKPGRGLWQKATATIEDILAGDAEAYAHLDERCRQGIFDMSIEILVHDGKELGKDFSVVDGGILIKDEVLQPLLDSMTPEDRAKFEEMGYIKHQQQDPFKMLEDTVRSAFLL